MSARDLYATLGVRPDASTEEIQAAYTRATQARQTALDDAFRVLSNADTRKAYDLGRASSSPLAMLHNTEDIRVPSLLASPFQLLSSVLDPAPVPTHDRDPWSTFSSPLSLFGRMLAPYSDPAPVWSTLDPSLPRRLPDSEQAQKEVQAERSPGLLECLFGPSASETQDLAVRGTHSSSTPRFTSFSRSYTSKTGDDGQVRVRAEEVGPDGTKTVYTRGSDGETVTVNGVAQTDHPWLRRQDAPAQITELPGDSRA